MKHSLKLMTLVVSSFALTGFLRAGPSPTAADVGDAESFGHAALYMGAASGFVQLGATCSPSPTPVPPATANDSQCFVVNPVPGSTSSFIANDILRIKLPKKATRTIIYPALNFFVDYQLKNDSGADQDPAFFNFTAELVIESDALLDPSIIDPQTGNPANGKLIAGFGYTYRDNRSMKDGDRQRLRETLVRVGNAGINKAALVAGGLSQTVVDNLFASAMTIRMNVTGSARFLTDANVTCNMRLFGD
jgi:hypothetical protein